MVLSASSYHAMLFYDYPIIFKRQVRWAGLGIIAMIFMNVDYYKIKKFVMIGFIITLILLGLVLIPGVGIEVKGSTRWLGVGSMSFSPSEIAKIVIVFFLARSMSQNPERIKSIKGFGSYLLILALVAGLLLKQPDLGTTLAIAGTAFAYIAAGARISHLAGLAFMGLMGS